MGQNSSIQDSQHNRMLREKLKTLDIPSADQYKFVRKNDDSVILLQNIENNKYYALRTLNLAAEEDQISLSRILQKRKKINCIHLCKLITGKKQIQTYSCSQMYKMHIFIQCPIKSIRDLFQQRKFQRQKLNNKNYFCQSELWGIAYSIVKALKSLYFYGISHESLTLQSMYIDEKGLIKLSDPVLFPLEKNYISAMKQKQQCLKLLSPQMLVFLQQYNFYFYEKQKSDIFVLGILLLQLGNLKQFQTYDYVQKKAKFQLIQQNLNNLKNHYSQKFLSALQWMTQIQPKKRPRLVQLLEFIDKNNSDRSTSLSNTIHNSPTQVPTVIVQRNLNRQKTVSAFSIDQKYHFQNPLIFGQSHIPESNSNSNTNNNGVISSIIRDNNLRNNNLGNKKSHLIGAQHNSNKKDQIKQRTQAQQSKQIFPFELVYNRIINNNENMKRFQVQNLYKQYKNYDMYGSSCRGSIPTSSYHAKIEFNSKDIRNKNLKIHDGMDFSKKSYEKADNLIYSHSSIVGESRNLEFSKNSLAQIQLVESNHIKQSQDHKRVRPDYPIQQHVRDSSGDQISVQSPYRRLSSLKSYQKSHTSIRAYEIQPVVFKNDNQFEHSGILENFNQERTLTNTQFPFNDFQNRYFSQQKQKDSRKYQTQNKNQDNKSQVWNNTEGKSGKKLTDTKFPDFKLQQKYDKYLLMDRIINKDSQRYISNRQIVDSSKFHSFSSSQLESKLSRATPNFHQKSRQGSISQKQSSLKATNFFTEQAELLFYQKDISQEGDIYSGYKNKLGLKQRHGKLQFHDGGYYEGQWKDDKMEGYGEMYYSNGALAYKGLWKQGCFNGNGQIFNDDPQHFEGPFNYSNFTQIQNKWTSYEGQFQEDAKHGKGRINLTNKQYFQGMFDFDMIEGEGTFHTITGEAKKGIWKDNQLIEQL